MLPGISIAAAFGAHALGKARPKLAWTAVIGMALVNGLGSYRLISSDHFTHGPHDAIMQTLGLARTGRTAIVLDETKEWGFVYFPLRYDLGENPPVYLAITSVGANLHRVQPDATVSMDFLKTLDHVLLVRARSLQTSEIATEIKGRPIRLADSLLLDRFRSDPDWREIGMLRHVSFVSAKGNLFERINH